MPEQQDPNRKSHHNFDEKNKEYDDLDTSINVIYVVIGFIIALMIIYSIFFA